MNYRHEWKHEISYGDLLVLRRRLLAVAKRDSQNSYSSDSQNSVPSQTDSPFESFGQIPQKAQDGNMFTAKPQEDMQNGQISQGQMPGAMPEGNMPSGQIPGGVQGGLSGSSDDVLLKYIDDSFDSYSNIFDNAKTDITDADKSRLISSLKNLSSGEDLENTLDIDAVIRYFAVHNFVLNFDSYTGSLIHNYYLYEQDGQMEMIPWDYNLAFGGFQSASDATALVNYPIDSPVSGGSIQDRPMIAWIFENEQYTNLYHEYFSELICQYFDSGYFETMMDDVIQMISPYVEKDPTKFCTYEEFETGAYTLKQFCLLRAKSIKAQLSGEISSTSENRDSDSLIDAGDLQISNMGSMNSAMSGGMAARGEREQSFSSGSGGQDLEESPPFDLQNSTASPQPPLGGTDGTAGDSFGREDSQSPDNSDSDSPLPELSDKISSSASEEFGGQTKRAENDFDRSADQAAPDKQQGLSLSSIIWLAVCSALLLAGIIFAVLFKRRK